MEKVRERVRQQLKVEHLDENTRQLNKKIHLHRQAAKGVSDEIDKIVQSGGRVGLNDPLSRKLQFHRNEIRKHTKTKVKEWKK